MILAALAAALLITTTPPATKAPAPAPQCTTAEAIAGQLTQGTTLLREFTGDAAARINRGLGGADDITVIRAYVNSQYPQFVWLVGFANNCMAAEGIVARADYDRLVGERGA